MEDDRGLELSLGLACGGSSSASKDKSSNSADGRTDTDERTSKILNDFRNFLNAGAPHSFQRTEPVKSQENFLNNVQQTATGGNASGNGAGAGDKKRKSMCDEMNSQKKQETDSRSSDKGKTSHISITTDEGSTGDNEDVAESEAEGSTSRLVPNHDDGSRTPGGSGSSSQAPKEIYKKANTCAPSYPVQTMTTGGVPYSITIKESPSVTAPSTPSYALSAMMQGINPTNGDHPGQHTTTPRSVPMTFGYSPVQIPDKDNGWGIVSRSQPLHSPYAGRSIPTSVSMHPGSLEAAWLDVRASEQLKGHSKLVAEEGSSSQSDDNAAGRANSFPSEYPAIRPGIAAEVNFGGSGSFPNLPWVSTTGPGPNGKTISGVTYKYNATQIKIVCACHGIHMSPEEFVQHASEEQPRPVNAPGIASLQSSNPPTSAKS